MYERPPSASQHLPTPIGPVRHRVWDRLQNAHEKNFSGGARLKSRAYKYCTPCSFTMRLGSQLIQGVPGLIGIAPGGRNHTLMQKNTSVIYFSYFVFILAFSIENGLPGVPSSCGHTSDIQSGSRPGMICNKRMSPGGRRM